MKGGSVAAWDGRAAVCACAIEAPDAMAIRAAMTRDMNDRLLTNLEARARAQVLGVRQACGGRKAGSLVAGVIDP
ncbi:hypothetical protein SAQ01S_21160 [Sphingomonas aquatilis NBRC 16722]|nr:hypothetical protein SAQ01S_21160 [Sphingomonas aquatilis NBRC 16722]